MSRFAKWSSVKQFYNSFYSQYFYNRRVNKTIRLKTKEFEEKFPHYNPKNPPPIIKMTYEGFQDQSCLARWDGVSDRDIGGDSKVSFLYNSILRQVTLKGQIITQNQDKLESMPFVAMIQKIPFFFSPKIFNSIRVQLLGDGEPVIVELRVDSMRIGGVLSRATILTAKTDDLVTYELPLRNFQIDGGEVFSSFDMKDKMRKTMSNLIETEPQLVLFSISFRMQSKKETPRKITFKKIELVRTMRGFTENQRLYLKPYFYIVDDNQEKDEILKVIDVGPFQYSRQK